MMDKEKGDLWDRFYDLEGSAAPKDDRIESLLHSIQTSNLSEVEQCVLRALVAYAFPSSITKSIDIASELLNVLSKEPSNTTARLYLGHYYFDNGEYSGAIQELQRIDTNEYVRADQRWRALKIDELILAARVWIGQNESIIEDIERFVRDITDAEPEDVAVPNELVISLRSNIDRVRKSLGREWIEQIGCRLQTVVHNIVGESPLSVDLSVLCGQSEPKG